MFLESRVKIRQAKRAFLRPLGFVPISLLLSGTVAAKNLLDPSWTMEKRLKTLEPFITPRPFQELTIADDVVKKLGKKDRNEGKLSGTIEVNPPQGHCLIFTRNPQEPDVKICKKQFIKWQLGELDLQNGSLKWSLRTDDPSDFGMPISWQTPYRIAKYIPSNFDFNEESSRPLFVRECLALPESPSEFLPRRIHLKLFTGDTIKINFPAFDKKIPPWEPPPPPPPEDDKKKKGHGEHGEHGDHGKDAKDGHGEAAAEPPPKKKDPPPMEAWTLSTRRGFEMPSSLVKTTIGIPGSKKGLCRYQFDAIQGQFENGRIECHYGEGFTYLYIPLSCMKNLKSEPEKTESK
jgi:hypothetical protein